MAVKHRLDEMILSNQNAVKFSLSQLEKMQRKNDQLCSGVCQLEKEAK